MKKLTFILAAATALVLASCEKKEQYAPEAAAETVVLNATLETPGTRTVLVDGTKVEWVAGDKISVFDGTDNVSAEASAGGATAQFAPALSTSGPWYAMYPFNAAATIDAGVISTVIPVAQTAVAGTFAPETNIAVALSSGSDLAFKNALGYIKFRMGCDLIKSVELKGNADENLAGAATIDYNAGDPVVTLSSTETAITLAPASGYFERDKYYYIAVKPQTLASGFKLTYTDAFGDTHEFSTSNSATIQRSHVLNIGTVDGESFRDEPIVFACAAVKADLLAHGIGGTINTAEIYKSEAAAVTYAQMSAFDAQASTATKANGYTIDKWGGWTNTDAITSFDEFKYFTGLEMSEGVYRTPVMFAQCKNLTSVTLPYNITQIANYTFQNCSSLATIHFPAGLTSIYARSFHNCTSLTGTDTEGTNSNVLDFPVTLKTISTQAFKNCGNIGKLGVASNTIETIKTGAFQLCKKMTLTSRVFGSLKTLEHGAFRDCQKLGSFNINGSEITEIPDSAFYNCKAMTAFYAGTGNKITRIGVSAFYGCQALATFTPSGNANKLITPDSCTSIGGYAFSHCYPLGSAGIVINEGVKTLGERVFRYDAASVNDGSSNDKKTDIILPSTLESMSYGCFSGNATYKMFIKSITCKATTPPTVTNIQYNDKTASVSPCLLENASYSTIEHIYVPAASVEAYKAAPVWSDFASVISAIE